MYQFFFVKHSIHIFTLATALCGLFFGALWHTNNEETLGRKAPARCHIDIAKTDSTRCERK